MMTDGLMSINEGVKVGGNSQNILRFSDDQGMLKLRKDCRQ